MLGKEKLGSWGIKLLMYLWFIVINDHTYEILISFLLLFLIHRF